MKIKSIVPALFFVLAFYQSVQGQNKITIPNFPDGASRQPVSYTIDLPFKSKVKSTEIKRSETPAFKVYKIKPKKIKEKLELSLNYSKNDLSYIVRNLQEAGGVAEREERADTRLLKMYKSAGDSSGYYVLLIKEFTLDSNKLCTILTLTGAPEDLDVHLAALKKSFYESYISP